VTPIAARCRLLLAGLAAAAMLTTPASAMASPARAAASCPDTPVAQPFSPWDDTADYFIAPGGDFESSAADWALRGRAAVVDGNEPFQVMGSSDTHSLQLPAGGAAVTPAFCIGAEHRSMRFFARAAARSSLDVDVLFTDPAGRAREVNVATLAGDGRWAPTDVVPMVVNRLAAAYDNAMSVRLRFTPKGSAGWAIDDVLIDPYRGR
jgi:hypothetical protein